jgi:type II secretory pathway component PulF
VSETEPTPDPASPEEDGAEPAGADGAPPAGAASPEPTPRKALSNEDLALLHKHLQELVAAKVPLPAGLKALAMDLSGGPLLEVVRSLEGALAQGTPLSEAAAACGPAIPRIYVELLAAGEETGDLAGSLELLVHQAEVDAEIDGRVRDAIVYPAVTLAFALIAGAGSLAILSSGYREMFTSWGVTLPVLTEFVLDLGAFCEQAFVPLVVVSLVLAALAPRWLKRVGRALLYPLVVPQLHLRNLAGFSRALGGFLARGVPAPRAMGAILRTGSDLFSERVLRAVGDRLEGGESLADALRAEPGAFPPTYVWSLAVAGERGTLPETLLDLARRYEDLFRRRVLVLTGLLTPVLLLGIGLLIAFSFLSIFLPMFEMMRMLQQ